MSSGLLGSSILAALPAQGDCPSAAPSDLAVSEALDPSDADWDFHWSSLECDCLQGLLADKTRAPSELERRCLVVKGGVGSRPHPWAS